MRYLLDTCVLSELVRPKPSRSVVAWVEAQDEHELFLSVVTFGELHKGIAKLPEGERRSRLERWVADDLATRFENRILPVDVEIAAAWGALLGRAEADGPPVPVIDALIGATARVHGCAVVTRDTAHFERTGVLVFDPWEPTTGSG